MTFLNGLSLAYCRPPRNLRSPPSASLGSSWFAAKRYSILVLITMQFVNRVLGYRPGGSSLAVVRPQGGALMGMAVDGLNTSNDIHAKHGRIPYSGNLSRVKTFAVSGQFTKVLPAKVLTVKISLSTPVSLLMDVSLSFPAIRESFNGENPTLSNSRKFSPAKDSSYIYGT